MNNWNYCWWRWIFNLIFHFLFKLFFVMRKLFRMKNFDYTKQLNILTFVLLIHPNSEHKLFLIESISNRTFLLIADINKRDLEDTSVNSRWASKYNWFKQCRHSINYDETNWSVFMILTDLRSKVFDISDFDWMFISLEVVMLSNSLTQL